MGALVPVILPALDAIRCVDGILGLRAYTVTLRVRTWSGERPGLGTFTDTTTAIVNTFVDGTTYPINVYPMTRRDALASGGRYVTGDLRCGPSTPAYVNAITGQTGGFTDAQLDPAVSSTSTELFWLVTGPALAANTVCEKVGEEASATDYFFILRPTGRQI